MDTFGWIEALENNFRYAAHRLRRSPGFTASRATRARVFDDLRGSNSRDVGMSAPHENNVSASPLDKQVQMRDTASGRLHSIAK